MKKYCITLLAVTMVAATNVLCLSCGDDEVTPTPSPILTPTESDPKTEVTGRIDAEVHVIKDSEIFMSVNQIGNGWYSYVLQFGFGANGADAYEKGMTQMRLTAWADNGCIDGSEKTSNYGKKETYTLYLSPNEREWYDWIFVKSKDTKITFNYELEYYNSKNGQWYDLRSKRLTFYAN